MVRLILSPSQEYCMKTIAHLLVATLALGGLAACDTMNDFHESVQVEDTTKDTKFNGVNGEVESYCSPAQRANKICY